jgi:hypothetical protein
MTGSFLNAQISVADIQTSIFELARRGDPRLIALSEKSGGVDCQVIESYTPVGTLRIWVAPSMQYNVAQFELERGRSPDGKYDSAKAIRPSHVRAGWGTDLSRRWSLPNDGKIFGRHKRF